MPSSAYEAVTALAAEYTFLLDDGDFEAVAELLQHAVLVPAMPGVAGDPLRGRDAIFRFYSEQVVTYGRGRPMTRHLLTNVAVSADEAADAATLRCYFTVLQRPHGLPFHVVAGGRYVDVFERVRGTWRYASKTIRVDHLNDIENHFIIRRGGPASP